MALSSPGIGSGLDVQGIVDQLVAIERRPVSLLASAKTKLDTQLSSYGLVQSYMSNLQSIAGVLAKPETWARNTANTSDVSAITATARASAMPATYTLEVSQLASAQSLSSPIFADPSDLGTGTLTITRGGVAVDVVIAAGETSLEAVRSKINQAGAGVTAAIVQDSGGPRLVLTGTDTGVANAVSLSVAGATGSLGTLTYPGGLQLDRPAGDAAFTVNGLLLSSASNRLENVIDGVDLTLSKQDTGPVQITISSDGAALKKTINDFVSAYNELNRYLSTQTKYEPGTETAGALQGDRTAVSLLGRLRSLVQQPSAASGVFGRLSDMGLSLERDGSLKVDDGKLTSALATPGELGKAFSNAGNGLALGFKALADGMLGVDGALTSRSEGLRNSIKRNEKDQERIEDRVERTRERLLRQYSALDTKLNQLTGLNAYITQQITNWNRSSDN